MTVNFIDLLDKDYPFPATGDRLIALGHLPNRYAELGSQYREFGYLILAYREGAQVMAKRAQEGARYERNRLVWPIAALYRHAIELSLKDVIKHAEELHGPTDVRTGHHDLEKLWRHLCRIVPQDCLENSEHLAFKSMLAELANLDPTNQSLRYPADRSGAPFALPGGIDLESLILGCEKF